MLTTIVAVRTYLRNCSLVSHFWHLADMTAAFDEVCFRGFPG
jgi:hypothetical protein